MRRGHSRTLAAGALLPAVGMALVLGSSFSPAAADETLRCAATKGTICRPVGCSRVFSLSPDASDAQVFEVNLTQRNMRLSGSSKVFRPNLRIRLVAQPPKGGIATIVAVGSLYSITLRISTGGGASKLLKLKAYEFAASRSIGDTTSLLWGKCAVTGTSTGGWITLDPRGAK